MVFGLLRSAFKKAPPLNMERPHEVAGRTLPLRIVENARAKRLTLRIDTGGRGLRVTVPSGIAMRDINEFILRHQGWLEAKLDKYPDRPKLRPGVKLPVRGVNHMIAHEPAKRGSVEQGFDEDGAYLIVHGERAHLGRRLAIFSSARPSATSSRWRWRWRRRPAARSKPSASRTHPAAGAPAHATATSPSPGAS